MVIIVLLILGAVLLIAELHHLRRCGRLAPFLFSGLRTPWTILGSLATLRLFGFTLVALSTIQLWEDSTLPAELNSAYDHEETDRLLILLDASLSMNIKDAGPAGDQSRGTRAADVIRDLVLSADRLPPRTTLVVFADAHYALILDTNDWRVIQASLNNRHLSEVLFDDEKTTLGAVLEAATTDLAKEWPKDSTALLVITDGDSEDTPAPITLPPAIRRSVVVGIGSAEGRLIGNFRSKRNDETLEAAARASGGRYYNATTAPVPTEALGRPILPPTVGEGPDRPASNAPAAIAVRDTAPLYLLAAGITSLIAALILSLILDPSKVAPTSSHENPIFLS